MTAVADLYRAVVLEHGKRPRNVGPLDGATHAANGENPLCGDALHVGVVLDGDRLTAVCFEGDSCLLATASASLMTEWLAGRTGVEARRLIAQMERVSAEGEVGEATVALADLRPFADVHRHPVRVQCAMLPWRTLQRALGV
ncbi:MAG: Fe-S cluster assembly sulfur transfer protein SufU [Candidatus Binatia bacterium]